LKDSVDRLSTDRENEGGESEGYLSAYDNPAQIPVKDESGKATPDVVKVNRSWYLPPKSDQLLQPRNVEDPLMKAEAMALQMRQSKKAALLSKKRE